MSDAFRRRSEPQHIRLYHSITGTDAWAALSGNAIKVLIALVRMDNGTKNGDLFFSARAAAQATGLSKNTAHKCLRELVDKGFIRITDAGRFHPDGGIASKYRITWQAWPKHCGPTREYEKWRNETKQKAVPKIERQRPKNCA